MSYEDIHREFLALLQGALTPDNRRYFDKQAEAGNGILRNGKWIAEWGAWQCRSYILSDETVTIHRGCAFCIVPKPDADVEDVYWMIAKNDDGSPCWDYSCTMHEIKKHIDLDDLRSLLHNAKRMMGEPI